MKVFQVISQELDADEIVDRVEFVAGDSMKQVVDHFTLEYEQLERSLVSAKEVITVSQDLRRRNG